MDPGRLKIRDLMTKEVVTIAYDATLAELELLLSTHGISGVPVLAERDELVGIVSKTDLTRLATDTLKADRQQGQVWQIMTQNVISVQADESVTTVARMMVEADIHRVLVYEAGEAVGIVTTLDFVKLIAREG